MLKEVHNTPNDYILFDWDNIKDEGETINKEGELLLMLEKCGHASSEAAS